MSHIKSRIRKEINAARSKWGYVGRDKIKELRSLLEQHRLSIQQGDVLLLDNRWYVTHSGLLRCARHYRCSGIETSVESNLSDPSANRWVFRAIVYGTDKSKSFVGYGDADPSNVSSMVHGAEMRIAETRAVNRALRKAYGIGLCSVEELGAFSSSGRASTAPAPANGAGTYPCNGSSNHQPRLRDQLCLLIRQFKLDPNLVKSYAADFCETETLSDASRERVEAFISHLAVLAKTDRDALICKLNSYAQPVEVRS